MLFSNASSALSLNPCVNPTFQPPIYALENINVVKSFRWDGEGNDTVSRNFDGALNFTLTDTANNYSLSCSWGQRPDRPRGYGREKDDWGYNNCVDPATGEAPPAKSRIATLLNLDIGALMLNRALQSPVSIAQYWWCDIVNGSFPDPPYQAHAEVFLDVACPQSGRRDSTVACNVTQPLAMKARWTPGGTLFPGTRQLERRPTNSPRTAGINPPPSRDCSDVSFSYPDWTINDLTYKEPVSWSDVPATASFNMSITHRPTGVRMRCQWGAEVGVTEKWQHVSEYIISTVCLMEGPDPLNSNSSLRVSFDATRKYLFPESRWRCADVAGTYSTEFRSKPAYPTRDEAIGLPLYCVSRICTLDTPFRIEGMLLAPASYLRPKKYTAPEGISNPACLRTSQGIEYWNSPFVITRFLWQATTITEIMYLGQGTGFPRSTRPHNRTLVVALRNSATNLESSCSFSDVALDGETDRWWPCFREAQDPHRRPLQRSVETWIQFSANAGLLRVNQTWYCNSENGEVPYKITGTATLPKTRGTGSAQGLLCGNGTNTFYGLACPQQFFITGDRCDYVYTAQWCTLGDREGYLNYPGIPLNMPIQSIETVRLPVGELTEPEPNPSVWSCTVASLGRGPVKWALQTSGWADLFSLTDWFGWIGHLTPEMNTGFTFDLNSSVFVGFPGTAYSKDGVIRGVGRVSEEDGPFLTPGMRSFDPSRVYTNTPLTDYWAPGWKFYQALGWEVRFDVSTGYMELKHSWYCDDKNVDTPIVFNGTWNGYVPLECKWEFPGVRTGDIQREGVMCRLTGGKKELVVVPTVTSFVSSKRIPDQIRQY